MGVPSTLRAIRQELEIKSKQIATEEVQLSPFAGDMLLCIENPKTSIKRLLELISLLGARYEINIQN